MLNSKDKKVLILKKIGKDLRLLLYPLNNQILVFIVFDINLKF